MIEKLYPQDTRECANLRAEQVSPGKADDFLEIWRIYVPLPENPLKTLNSYVVKTKAGNLLIDTGFCRQECMDGLRQGMEEIELSLAATSLFLTHLHSDHSGLVPWLLKTAPMKVYMGKDDFHYLSKDFDNEHWNVLEQRFLEEGFPEDVMLRLRDTNQARTFAPPEKFKAELLEDGQMLEMGAYHFQCIQTPGHTPGHMCLYLKEKKILFSGDHVLFDITPNITSWNGVRDSLADYLKSLDKIITYDVAKTFPGHRGEFKTLYERVDELKQHHKKRLQSIYDSIERRGEASAYEVASDLKWNMRQTLWKDFPDNQKWFAVGETLSHLDYLENRGKIERVLDNGKAVYRAVLR